LSDSVGAPEAEVTFSARIRKDHRIAIPTTERAVLGVKEGDLVTVRLRRAVEAQGASQ